MHSLVRLFQGYVHREGPIIGCVSLAALLSMQSQRVISGFPRVSLVTAQLFVFCRWAALGKGCLWRWDGKAEQQMQVGTGVTAAVVVLSWQRIKHKYEWS